MNDTRREVLARLGEAPTPGPDLAGELGVSRTAVWKQIEALRSEGFEIESGEEGYAITGIPEYGAGAVGYRLDREFRVEYHRAIGSTNERARDLAREGASEVVVLADEQTGGRGRLDRGWISPSGGVWTSLLLRPDLPPARVPLLTLAAAVATVRVVRDRGVDAGLKWPNDVLAVEEGGGERKLAGILTEMEGEADAVSWVVVGIGLNANVDGAELPDGATSLRERAGDVDRARLVSDLLEAFDDLRSDPSEILPAWRDHSLTLGRQVRVDTGGETVVGRAVGVESPGGLRIDTGEGEVRVHAGDCEHLRRIFVAGTRPVARMDEKTEELRDIFVDVTETDTVTETQADPRGSIATDEGEIEERLRSIVGAMEERYDLRTDFSGAELVEIVRQFYAGKSDAEIARELEPDAENHVAEDVARARIELHLVTEADREGPIELDALRGFLHDEAGDVSAADVSAEFGVSESTARRHRRLVEVEDERRLIGDRFRQEFEHVLADRALSKRLTDGVKHDGLDDATEDAETDVSF